ncbi:YGGT family protein [Desulfitobacterium hafniense DP7]|uniref:YGGT family protein n=1 Tax=Desulfitobacterium hafniense DP7 TaxID=537010 RepID=G9XLU4_DESHA|nr:YggT family protein [Desulfitobacterium hafniense]EHL07370.1 YGGT family protein [Desulfitobacterium hafniense DP7]
MIIIIFVYQVADKVLLILMYAIILRALLSWIPNLPYNAFVRILHDITDPLIRPFERLQFGGPGFAIGLAPLIAYFVLMLVRSILLPGIFSILLRI